MRVVVKVGSSSVTDEGGWLRREQLRSIVDQIADARSAGHAVVLVSSGAIASGLPLTAQLERPQETPYLRAAAAVGQVAVLSLYQELFRSRGLEVGQLLIIPSDFSERNQYLHARQTLEALLSLGVVPIINENDALSNDQIRFGDNDKIAALISNLIAADLLLLLTDQKGLFTSDPRVDVDASLVEEVNHYDSEVEEFAGGAGTRRGSGGMASKVQAARMAAWSGVETVIASADSVDVIANALAGERGVGTRVLPHERRLSARKLWIAFASKSHATVLVDDGAMRALREGGSSLLPVGVRRIEGRFGQGDSLSIATLDGAVFAKGIASADSEALSALVGLSSRDVEPGEYLEVVHRDNLVVLA